MGNPFESRRSPDRAQENKEKIEKYLSEVLPDAEPRIQQPMDPKCEVAVVIPSYGERKPIFRTIQSLLDQQGVTPEEFEVLIIVNNPASQPTQKSGEEDNRFQERLNTYQKNVSENQDVLRLIGMMQQGSVDVPADDHEREVVEKLRTSGFCIFSVDKASPGRELPAGKDPVGSARNRGSAEAIERFSKQNKNGLLIHTDADTALDSNYIATAIKVFKQRPELVGAVGTLEFDRTSEDESMQQLYFFTNMNRLLRDLAHYHQTGEQDYKKELTFSGSAMISRAFETAIVGGIPEKTERGAGEDKLFGERLKKIGIIDKISELVVHPLDRISVATENLQKGHGHIRFTQAQQIKQHGEILVEDGMPISVASEKILDELCKNDNLKKKYQTLLENAVVEPVPPNIDKKFGQLLTKLKAMDKAKREF